MRPGRWSSLRFRFLGLVLLAVLPAFALLLLDATQPALGRVPGGDLLAMVAVVVLALIAAWFGSDWVVLRRLRELLAATQRVTAGDLTARANPAGGGELGELAREFNQMAAAVAARGAEHEHTELVLRESERRARLAEEQIRAFAVELEQRVAERTRALEKVNLDLEAEIRQRQQADELVRIGRQELREYVDHMSTLNAKVTPDGRLLLVNRIAELASGMSREELMRTNFLKGPWWSFDPEVQERVRVAFARAVAGENVSYDERLFVFGRVITISFGLSPVFDDAGKVGYVLAEGRDISQQKEAEASLQQRTAELEAANKELEAFSYSVSHDLRAPLRAIDGFSKILEDDHRAELSEEARRQLSRVRENTRQMADLIGDLLSFSRLSRQPLARRQVSTERLVREALAELGVERGERKVEVRIGALPECDADAPMLKQVFVNLLSNALKYTRKQPVAEIEVGARPLDGALDGSIYFVRDNGVGFDMRYADRLFGVFQRLHPPDEFEGTGVGLAIAQRIVYRHGGRIWADAEPDRGATFSFTLGAT